MRDWKAIAKARGLDLTPRDIDGMAASLDALDDILRPLLNSLTPDLEPDVSFSLEEDGK
jgi:hypothetical protein